MSFRGKWSNKLKQRYGFKSKAVSEDLIAETARGLFLGAHFYRAHYVSVQHLITVSLRRAYLRKNIIIRHKGKKLIFALWGRKKISKISYTLLKLHTPRLGIITHFCMLLY